MLWFMECDPSLALWPDSIRDRYVKGGKGGTRFIATVGGDGSH